MTGKRHEIADSRVQLQSTLLLNGLKRSATRKGRIVRLRARRKDRLGSAVLHRSAA